MLISTATTQYTQSYVGQGRRGELVSTGTHGSTQTFHQRVMLDYPESVRWQHYSAPRLFFGVVTQPTDSRLSETANEYVN